MRTKITMKSVTNQVKILLRQNQHPRQNEFYTTLFQHTFLYPQGVQNKNCPVKF